MGVFDIWENLISLDILLCYVRVWCTGSPDASAWVGQIVTFSRIVPLAALWAP